MIQLTHEKIDQLMTPRGGFTHATLRELGVEICNGSVPPWRRHITGSWVSNEKWERLLATRTMTAKRRAQDQSSLFG